MTASEHRLFMIRVHSQVSSTGTGAEQLFHKQENTENIHAAFNPGDSDCTIHSIYCNQHISKFL